MANSFTKVTLGAAQTVGFTTPTYIVSSHLTVSVNNVTVPAVQAGATQQVFGSFTSTNPLYYILVEGSTSLSFSEELPAGAVVLVNRNSSQNTKLVSYSDSGLLTSDVLNEDSNQAFFIAQEALDQSAGNFDSSFEASQGVTVAKVAGIEALADVTDTANVVAALTAGTNITIAADGTIASTDTNTTYTVQDGQLSQNNFTDADHTKLNAIEASADVTDTANVVAALTAGTNVAIASNGTISSTDTNTTYTGGTGLTLAGTTFNVDAAQTGITSLGTLSGLTTGATTVNGSLTVNNDLFEIISTTDDATEKPIMSLWRTGAANAANDELGAIRWFGQNNSDEKQFFGGIYVQADDVTDGAHKGSLNFHLADGSNNGTNISDVLVDINGDEDPTMSLTSELLTVKANVLIQATVNDSGIQATPTPILELYQEDGPEADDGDHLGEIQFTAYNANGYSPAKHKYAGIHAEIIDESNATEDGSLHFTAITAGTEDTTVLTLNGTESTFTTPLVVTGGLTASQTLANAVTDTDISVSEFATYNGKKLIYTGGAGSIHLADAVAADIGKAWVIINAGTGAITINRATSTQTIKLLDGSAISAGSANLTLATGGIIEIICTAADNYIAFGTGIS